MTTDTISLLARAAHAAENAHVPYSGFRVGAVVVLPDGTIHEGCNVENAAYPATVCAEVNAITTAVAHGANEIDTIAIACLDGEPCVPCGNCRQVMREFGVRRILMRGSDGDAVEMTLEDLLPNSFGPEALGESREQRAESRDNPSSLL